MRVPRSVTFVPIGMPSLSFQAASDFFARVRMGFCPAMIVRSFTAASRALGLPTASPTPMLMMTFSIFGSCMMFL